MSCRRLLGLSCRFCSWFLTIFLVFEVDETPYIYGFKPLEAVPYDGYWDLAPEPPPT